MEDRTISMIFPHPPATELPAMPGVYAIVNRLKGHFYIGSSINLKSRRSSHFRSLKNGKHTNPRLQRVWDKYGDIFDFVVLELCERSEITMIEQKWLDNHNAAANHNCYNILPTAYSPFGREISDETRRKISERKMGKKLSLEHRESIRLAKIGVKQSPEAVEKRRQAQIGRPQFRTPGYDSKGHRKFTEEQVIEMRKRKAQGDTYAQIQTAFNVTCGSLIKILQRSTYRNV